MRPSSSPDTIITKEGTDTTGILIGTQEVRCVFGETAAVGTFTLRVFVLESEWQRQQNSKSWRGSSSNKQECVQKCVYVGECRVKIIWWAPLLEEEYAMKNGERRRSRVDSVSCPSPCCCTRASTPPAASYLDELQVPPRSKDHCHSALPCVFVCVCNAGKWWVRGVRMCVQEQTHA